jgi:hypothetical protein
MAPARGGSTVRQAATTGPLATTAGGSVAEVPTGASPVRRLGKAITHPKHRENVAR